MVRIAGQQANRGFLAYRLRSGAHTFLTARCLGADDSGTLSSSIVQLRSPSRRPTKGARMASVEIRDGLVIGDLPGPGGRTYTVEHHMVPRTANQPFLNLEVTPANLVLHTTEGHTVDGAIGTMTTNHDPAQWLVGEHRIAQLRPITAQGAAVDTENGKAMQIEMVAFSQLTVWLPDEPSLFPLVALVAYLDQMKFISSLERPPKLAQLPLTLDVPPGGRPPATNEYFRRFLGEWPNPGVYGHVDLPNDEHFDPGAFDYPTFFEMVREVQGGGEDVSVDELLQGMRRRIMKHGAPPDTAPQHVKDGFEIADAIFDAIAAKGSSAAAGTPAGEGPDDNQ